ncbi:interleukin-1 receptor-like 1 isoform X2 [Siniperca chuatsi]|uniref:interleukin-1 receptor-like 1 isoform X2 n=1 Tax=Siniperca chuatsi TaxID=119488 RepID=UPI001CE07B3D|nr:interleukin-1 receptor-like 1 isoform X2 [Siniperca chuatsi]
MTSRNITFLKIEKISTDDSEMVHYHGGALFFLKLLPENSGLYTARHTKPSGECDIYSVKVEVLKTKNDSALLYGEINNSDQNKKVTCPDPVSYTCETMKGEFTWYKDFVICEIDNEDDLWVYNATKDNEGIYTCMCTWTYNHKVYNSSGSRRLIVKDQAIHRKPVILSATGEQFADEGFGIKLNCSVFCGTNVEGDCHASWNVNGITFSQTDGYNETTKVDIEERSKNTISTAILNIEKVSAKDFQAKFICIGMGSYQTVSVIVTLKRRESIIPLVIGGVCVLFFCVFAAGLVKFFAIDLALFFRPYFPLSHNKDARVYDAYVVYQMQNMDKVTEDSLCRFVTINLPSVLEEKCGYRLFIHGRDDIPGEDRLELVEDRMKQSRRLMVILTPGLGSGSVITDQHLSSPENSEIGGFDWQVGLHYALVQREMTVILIQLGNTEPQGYTHLPPGLQHLIRKSAPIRWPEDSRGAAAWNSRFWKRVRYLMPATPAKKCEQSAII